MATERNDAATRPSDALPLGASLDAGSTAKRRKNKWALLAEEMSRKGYLRGCSEEVHQAGKEFREGLSIGDE